MGERFVETTGAELWARIDAAQRAFVGLLGEVGPDASVVASDWRSSDVARHLLTVYRRYTRRDFRARDGLSETPAGITEQNDAQLAALEEMAMPELLAALGQELQLVRYVLPEDTDIDERFPFHAGTEIDAAAALANLIGELVVHGYDVATANRRPWYVDPLDARLILSHLVQIGPAFVRPGARPVRVGLVVEGARPWLMDIHPGRAISRPLEPAEPVDARVRAPAPTALLAFYGRYSLLGAARHGMFVTGGRRPWRVVRLQPALERV